MVGLPPRPSHEVGLHRGVNAQYPQTSSHPGNPPPVPVACGQKPSVGCFYPLGYQWFVPFMPPFQGLVYRPCTSPVYGSCCPLSTHPVTGNFMNPAYGIPTSHQQPNIVVPPAVKQASTCNMANPKNESISGCLRKFQVSKESEPKGSTEAVSGRIQKFQASKESELQGSAASSSCKKVQVEGRDALPLFSVSSVLKAPSGSCGSDNQPRVIKAVPHSARSAPGASSTDFPVYTGREATTRLLYHQRRTGALYWHPLQHHFYCLPAACASLQLQLRFPGQVLHHSQSYSFTVLQNMQETQKLAQDE
ncbi:hypothetical protein J5N97_004933 [Dioscorea zingiberensis]|uniref:Uncharacterized protein n=1 Tax=Dioscorea zingiberensis TaxID=325984 RepID=A0A9D5D9D2_9LILI|nr:hypothetical protein J5N97_004933 [Dioscorea zingiberensis]